MTHCPFVRPARENGRHALAPWSRSFPAISPSGINFFPRYGACSSDVARSRTLRTSFQERPFLCPSWSVMSLSFSVLASLVSHGGLAPGHPPHVERVGFAGCLSVPSWELRCWPEAWGRRCTEGLRLSGWSDAGSGSDLGMQFITRPIGGNLRVHPGADVGFGDNATLASLHIDFAQWFQMSILAGTCTWGRPRREYLPPGSVPRSRGRRQRHLDPGRGRIRNDCGVCACRWCRAGAAGGLQQQPDPSFLDRLHVPVTI